MHETWDILIQLSTPLLLVDTRHNPAVGHKTVSCALHVESVELISQTLVMF
jgi:hypothetical protein